MVQKKEREYFNGPTPVDESWWNAVLEDVEAIFTPEPRIAQTNGKREEKQEEEAETDIDWGWVESLYKQDQVIRLEVTSHNRGGLLVAGDRIQGFVPASHLVGIAKSPKKEEREDLFSTYVGRSLQLKVIECDPERGRIVLSERAAQSDPGSRLELLSSLRVGDCVQGRVTTITKFGVFVDLGGVEGLIHVSELSWGRVCDPNEIVSVGDEIEVRILQMDNERNRIALSLKRLCSNPWDTIHERYQVGQVTDAEITNIVSYGAFARLEEGVDGLIHISGIENLGPNQKPNDLFFEGQQIRVNILHIDAPRQRLGLGLYSEDESQP